MTKISVVINTWNEEENIKRCLESVKWVDEIVVVDMESTDKTVEVAKKYGAKVFFHKYTGYVEPARNFALRCAQGKHILVLDVDEEIPATLAKKLQGIAKENKVDFVRIPRKNIIFGQWIKYSRWWPDYNVRFFRRGKVTWPERIHGIPEAEGKGRDLEAKEVNAIIHYHYQSISQYLERVNRYTDVQARELINSGYKFTWKDLFKKPSAEFLSRFFAGEGYKDGLHGLVLALLQTFSELIKYLKVWETKGFETQELSLSGFLSEIKKLGKELTYWVRTSLLKEAKGTGNKFLLKIRQKLSQ